MSDNSWRILEHTVDQCSRDLIQSTFDTKTRLLLEPKIARDLDKGRSFRQLRERPTTVYIVLPAGEITRKRRWTRLLLTDALLSH